MKLFFIIVTYITFCLLPLQAMDIQIKKTFSTTQLMLELQSDESEEEAFLMFQEDDNLTAEQHLQITDNPDGY